MASRTREEKLFGAACLKLTLEARGAIAAASEIYRGSLADLGLSEDEVERYLDQHRAEVEARLSAKAPNRRSS